MGMDYQYAGSASYPRFDEELCEVAKVFGGKPTKYLLDKKSEMEKANFITKMFGFYNVEDNDIPKFIFPEVTDKILVKWFNNVYKDLSPKETRHIWEIIRMFPHIENISSQIYHELEYLVAYKEGWSIN